MRKVRHSRSIWECPHCHSRYLTRPTTLGVDHGTLVQIHPVCPHCFETCPSCLRPFGYGDVHSCGSYRLKVKLIRKRVASDDPILGLSTTGSTSYPETQTAVGGTAGATPVPNYIIAQRVNLINSGTISKVGFNVSGAAGNARVALYSDGTTKPNALLVESASTAISGAGWKDIAFTTPYYATAGYYWTCVNTDNTNTIQYYSSSGETRSFKAYAYDAMPSTWPSGSTEDSYGMNQRITQIFIQGYMKFTKAVLAELAISINNVSVYSHAAVGNLRIAIFDNASPKAKMWESGSVAAVAAAWKTVNVSDGTPTTLTNIAIGTYHLGWQYDNVGLVLSYTAGSSGDGFYKTQAYGAFPATISGETSSIEKWSIYALYESYNIGNISVGSTTYPVTKHGDANLESTSANFGGGGDTIFGSDKFALTESGTVKDIVIYYDTAVTGHVRYGIYADVVNYPGGLQVETGELTNPSAGWVTHALAATHLQAGSFWIAALPSASIGAWRYVASGVVWYKAQTYGAMPATFPSSASSATATYSWYVELIHIIGFLKATKAILSETASIVTMSFYCHTSPSHLYVGIYDDASPKALVWKSEEFDAVSVSWVTTNISDGTPSSLSNLAAGTYHLFWEMDSVGNVPSYTAGSAGDGWYSPEVFGDIPATLSSVTSTAEIWSIYATYVLISTVSKTYGIDTLLAKINRPTSFNADTLIKGTSHLNAAIDVLFKKLNIPKTYGLDARLIKLDIPTQFKIDAFVKAISQLDLALDAILKKTDIPQEFAIDISLTAPYAKELAIDLLLKKLDAPESFNIDTLLQALHYLDMAIDAIFKKVDAPQELAADMILVTTFLKTLAIDIFLKMLDKPESLNIDTLIVARHALDLAIGVFLIQEKAESFDIDAMLQRSNIPSDFATDLLLQCPAGMLQLLINVMLQKENLPSTFGIDISLVYQRARQFLADIKLKKYDVSRSLSVDALIKKYDLSTSYAADAIIKAIRFSPYIIDMMMKRLDITETANIDILLATTFAENLSIDVAIRKLDIPQTFAVDVLIASIIEATYSIDAILRKISETRFNSDIRLRKTVISQFRIDIICDVVAWLPTLPTSIGVAEEYLMEGRAEGYTQLGEVESYDQEGQEMPDRPEWSR